jgi:ElaB/YqjD/DUF883 family membrane-anchored ribosome-binding protein
MSNTDTERSGPRMKPGYESAIDDIAERGAAALREAKAGVDEAVADVRQKESEALDGARDLRDAVADKILDSIRRRPYTTLVLAGLAGFLYGAMRRR